MNDLVTARHSGVAHIVPGVAAPKMSPPLDAAVYAITQGGGLADNVRADLLAQEAAEALPAIERLCMGPDENRLRLWLGRLNGLVVSLPAETFETRVADLSETLRDLPAAIFTGKTAAEVARTGDFFPTLKRIMDVLEPKAREFQRLRHGLRTIAAAKAPLGLEGPSPSSEVDQIVSGLGARLGGSKRGARQVFVPRHETPRGMRETPIPAAYLSPEERQKAYENAASSAPTAAQRKLLEDRAARLASHTAGTESHTNETTPGEGL